MKKIFTFIAAMLVAFAASAATININPGSNTLRVAVSGASSGDVIVMAAGEYNESGDYIAFTGKEVTVRAAENAEVIIKTVCPVRLKEGARAEFVNVKFDCSVVGSYDYVIVAADDTENKRVILKGCEFYNWEKNKSMIEATSSRRLDSIVVDNCYFHDCMKSVIFVENTGFCGLKVTNSTFANISTTTGSYYAGVIDSRATTGSLLVDHCTFYNVQVMATDYAAVGKVASASGNIVSNCIFAMPTSTDGVRTIRDHVTANNCLVYNYSGDSGYGMQSNVTKNNCIKDQNPLFTDAANGDFTLSEGSPALGKGTDDSNLGDPRWWPNSVVFTAGTVLTFDATAYGQGMNIYLNAVSTASPAADDGASHWFASTTSPIQFTLTSDIDVSTWQNVFKSNGSSWNDVAMHFPADNSYTVLKVNAAGNDFVWEQPAEPTPSLENGYYIAGIINGAGGWSVSDLSADRQLIHSNEVDEEWYKDITLAIGDEFKVVYVENNAINTWYPASPAGNYVIEADHAGAKTIYFRPDGVDHPELNDGWYYGKIYVQPNPIQLNLVAGWNTVCLPYAAEIANVDAYEIQDINFGGGTVSLTPMNGVLEPATAYLINAAAAGEHTATLMGGKVTTPVEVDGFLGNLSETLVVLNATDEDYAYFVLSGNEFHLLTGTATANVAQYKAYIRFVKLSAPSVLRIVNGATNIQNVEGNETAVKFIENGKLFIKKNGVVYDAVGTVVK